MITIRPLDRFDPDRFALLAAGYTTTERYRVECRESDAQTSFTLTLEALPQPEVHTFNPQEVDHYQTLVGNGYCLGAYEGAAWVGVALAEPHQWNNTLWVWEFHVDADYQGQGVGRRLMEALVGRAAAAGLRAIVCETQNNNVPAIRFYRALRFYLAGVDVAHYTNEDRLPGGSVALFMKRSMTDSKQ